MDISINSNKYAKLETLQNLANAIDEKIEQLDNRINLLMYLAEGLDTRIALLTLQQESKETKLDGDIVFTQAIITDTIATPKQKKEISAKINKYNKIVSDVFKQKEAQYQHQYEQEIKELKKKYNIA